MAVPVTKSDAGLARNTAMPLMSSGVPQRRAGVRINTMLFNPDTSARARLVRSVSIQPGSTALTWMLSLAQAVARARLNCTMPPLEAAWAGAKEAPKIDIIEPMLMILPAPAAFMWG